MRRRLRFLVGQVRSFVWGLDGTECLPKSVSEKREHAMGATMPFSKLDLDPEHIEAIAEPFRRVCDILQLQCSREDPLTDLVVMKIMELARAGERDPEILCIDTLATLGPRSPEATPPPSHENVHSSTRTIETDWPEELWPFERLLSPELSRGRL